MHTQAYRSSLVVLAVCMAVQAIAVLRFPSHVGVGFVVSSLVFDLLLLGACALGRRLRHVQ